MARNQEMVARIAATEPTDPLRFVFAGDSGAWADPTADGIFRTLMGQVAALDPRPAFFANVGDFAGPGTRDRHEDYLRLVSGLPIPDICVVGNHDLDDAEGLTVFEQVHGPVNFTFALGHARFVCLHAEPGIVGEIDVPGMDTPEGTEGPREDDLAFLDETLASSPEPVKVILMHMPPHLGGRYAPHDEWGFKQREDDFLDIVRRHGVALVCCAHGLAFDTCVHDGVRYVMSGGGGTGLCSHLRGVCAAGDGRPEDRGALFHVTEISIARDGRIGGRVIQAFDDPNGRSRITFGDV